MADQASNRPMVVVVDEAVALARPICIHGSSTTGNEIRSRRKSTRESVGSKPEGMKRAHAPAPLAGPPASGDPPARPRGLVSRALERGVSGRVTDEVAAGQVEGERFRDWYGIAELSAPLPVVDAAGRLGIERGGEREDKGERMATALGPARIGHRRETVQQMRVFLGLDRPGSGDLAQASRDGR